MSAASSATPSEDTMLGRIRLTIKKFNTINKDGKRWRYTEVINGKKLDAIKYFRSTRVMNDTLRTITPGIYTWILKGGDFYANKVLTQQEIGSLHFILDLLADVDGNRGNIEAAGEMIVSDDRSIIFNLLSGTYYKEYSFKTQNRKSVPKTPEEMRELETYVLVKIKTLGKTENVTYDNSGNTFITGDMVTNNSTLAKLNEYITRIESLPNASEGGKRRTRRRMRRTKKSKTRK
jgi:hypothetical protein